MSGDPAAPGDRLRRLWRLLSGLPGGDRLFSRLVGWIAPYSGSIRARITHLEAGHCRADLPDRRRVRNHLDSLHAVALVNLGELVTGLATLTALPTGVRGIVRELGAEYEKKARGRVTAECRTEVPPVREAREHVVQAEIRDREGDVVARVEATWRLSPPESAGEA